MRVRLLLVLASLFFWSQVAPAVAEVKAEKKTEAKAEKSGGESESKPRASEGGVVHDGSKGARIEGDYITIAPIIITVFGKNGKVGKLSAVFALELESEEAVAVAAIQHTKLRDALIRELNRLSERETRRGREYTIGQIKRRVQVIVGRQLGEEAIRDVLVVALTRS